MRPSATRIGLIAGREFQAAVMNKGFVIGLLLMPLIIAGLAVVFPRMTQNRAPDVRGDVAVIDPTGQVIGALRESLAPAALAKRRLDGAKRALENAPAPVRDAAAGSDETLQRAIGTPPELTILDRSANADLQREKTWLTAIRSSGQNQGSRHLALIVVQPDAVTPAPGRSEYGGYDLYVPENLDERIETELYDAVRESLVSARIRAHNLDRAQVEAVMRVRRPSSVTVTATAERRTNTAFNRALPWVFAGLLVFGVMIGGQTLLTQTIEEKSNRVIEVLLSAVSPIELMAGKILGQMAVSLLVLALYIGMGLFVLLSFALIGLLDPLLVIYLVLFFLISYLLFAAIFAAVGAAVNEMREAQSLMTPVMLALMAPWLFAPLIGREPNSTFAIVMSFLPPVNTFAMMIRLASTTPPPLWQVAVSMVIGVAAAWVVTWLGAKVFKVGLLMHGKPPSMGTLVRWAREA
jgi:ABC-2 type transport system permease protein